MFVVATFYHFSKIEDPQALAAKLKKIMLELGIKGTFIIAHEGLNATISGTRASIDELNQFLLKDFLISEYKESVATKDPFKRLKVHFKKEIVTLGVSVDPNNAGAYVEPKDWNRLICDPDVICLDVRNDFEVKLGTFKHAINPHTKVFRDFPNFVKENLCPNTHKKIAMSCTGGIRCEKASAMMKEMGFSEVFHLKGGILKYLEEIPETESLWQGDCFVFDERIAVNHRLEPQVYQNCPTCGEPKLEELCQCIRNKKPL